MVACHRPVVNAGGAKSVLDVEDWQLDAVIDRLDGVLNIASKKSVRGKWVAMDDRLDRLSVPARVDEGKPGSGGEAHRRRSGQTMR